MVRKVYLCQYLPYLPLSLLVLTSSLSIKAVKAQTVETEDCSVNLSPCYSLARDVAQSQDNFVVGAYSIRPANLSGGPETLEGARLALLQEFCPQTGATNVIPKSCNAPSSREDSVSPIPLHKRETQGDQLALSTASGVDTVQSPDSLAQIPQAPQLPSDIDLPTEVQEQEPPSEAPLAPQPPTLLPPPEQLLESPQGIPPTPEAIPGKVPETITVERFEFEGNTAISDEDLAEATAQFTNKLISFAELFQARSAVTQLYLERGYITSGALIPLQTIEDGVVRIQVIEGGLESINVTGTERLNPNYVRSRLEIATEKPLNRDRLLEALQLLQLDPLIQNLSAELAAGTEPGLSVLDVVVTEAETFSVQFSANNNRAPSVGSFDRGVQINQANLLGDGDGLSLGYNNTSGSDGLNISYTRPVNPQNGTLTFSFGTTNSQVIEPPFERLDIEADSRYYELTFRQPIYRTPTEEFAFGLTATRQESETSLLEIPFALSLGADEQGRTRISAVRFFQEWTKRNSNEVIAARSQFSFGTGAFDATINEEAPDSRFFSWRGQAQWVRLLAPDTLLLVRADAQLADRALVPLEQFGLGGQETVRGYRQDILLTDNGVLASAEVRIPVLRLPQLEDSIVQLAPFVDIGAAWNNSGRPDPDPNVLASIGLGLQWQLGDILTLRLDYGIPLVSISSSDRTWQESGFYFSIIASPF
jgi:hemolysin activation/secretion protein